LLKRPEGLFAILPHLLAEAALTPLGQLREQAYFLSQAANFIRNFMKKQKKQNEDD